MSDSDEEAKRRAGREAAQAVHAHLEQEPDRKPPPAKHVLAHSNALLEIFFSALGTAMALHMDFDISSNAAKGVFIVLAVSCYFAQLRDNHVRWAWVGHILRSSMWGVSVMACIAMGFGWRSWPARGLVCGGCTALLMWLRPVTTSPADVYFTMQPDGQGNSSESPEVPHSVSSEQPSSSASGSASVREAPDALVSEDVD